MSRNRVIYQTESLFAGPSPATGRQLDTANSLVLIKQLHRIQSINYGYSLNRRDVNQYGELAAIDRILLESPVINLDFSYLNFTFYNESSLGFYVNSGQGDSSAITNILNKTNDDRNYYIKTVYEGSDAMLAELSGSNVVFTSVGNGFISNYSTEGAVGDFPKTTVSVEGLNMTFQQAYSGNFFQAFTGTIQTNSAIIDSPAINPSNGTAITGYAAIPISKTNPVADIRLGSTGPIPSTYPYTISALTPGDITLDFFAAGSTSNLNDAGALISDAKIQSYNLSFGLTRDPLQKIGSKYAFAREIRFPVQVNLSVDANVGDLQTGNLIKVISDDNSYDVRIKIKHNLSTGTSIMVYTLKQAKLDSQNFTSSIGPNKSVTLNFSSQIGGPLQTNKGLFFSGLMSALP